jgi:hypothetical protein
MGLRERHAAERRHVGLRVAHHARDLERLAGGVERRDEAGAGAERGEPLPDDDVGHLIGRQRLAQRRGHRLEPLGERARAPLRVEEAHALQGQRHLLGERAEEGAVLGAERLLAREVGAERADRSPRAPAGAPWRWRGTPG